MRIFQIGFSDCGEAAIGNLLHKNGIRTLYASGRYWHLKGHPAVCNRPPQLRIHRNIESGRSAIDGLEDFQAFCGLEYMQNGWSIENFRHFATLAEENPDALFILNTCDTGDWLSRRMQRDNGLFLEHAMDWTGMSRKGLLNLWTDDFHRHHAMVREYFYARPRQLFEFDIDRTPVKALCKFLRPAARVWPRFWQQSQGLIDGQQAA